MMIGIVLIHLGQLNAAANELVGDYNLDHSAVLIYLHGIRRLIHPSHSLPVQQFHEPHVRHKGYPLRKSCRPLRKQWPG